VTSNQALAHLRAAHRELEALWPLITRDGQDELTEAMLAISTVYLQLSGAHYAWTARRLIFAASEPNESTRERIMDRLHRSTRHLDDVRQLMPNDEQRPLTEARWAVVRVLERYQIIYECGRLPAVK
jgi:hypothetical protein